MKKIFLIGPVIIILAIGAWLLAKSPSSSLPPPSSTSSSSSRCPDGSLTCYEKDSAPQFEFIGKKGEKATLENNEIKLSAAIFSDNKARFYNVEMPDSEIIYFFVVKDKNGIYRAAASACQVCFAVGRGFRQEGDEIVCNNCGNRYPIEKIATEKGGCNPGPIDPNLEVRNGDIIVKQVDLEQVLDLMF